MTDSNPGGGYGRADQLTDRIGLGVLTRLVHRDLVDEVLAETGRTDRRRRLPARVVVYFVLAMKLFFDDAAPPTHSSPTWCRTSRSSTSRLPTVTAIN